MKRDSAIDALRGLMLVIMAIDHFGGPLRQITWQPFGFVSAAEGFVFLSGLVCGMVYGRYADEDLLSMPRRVYRRALVVYLAHVSTVLLLLLWIQLFPTEGALASYGSFWSRPIKTLILSLGFLYQPGRLGILPMYVVFLVCLPFVLRRFRAGAGRGVLLASGVLWGFAQFRPREAFQDFARHYAPIELGFFDILAWQFLYFFAVWVGYFVVHRRTVQLPTKPLFIIIAVVLFLGMAFLRHFDFCQTVIARLFNFDNAVSRTHLGWLRLVNFLLTAFLVSRLVHVRRGMLANRRWLALLGRHSLPVFWYHVLAAGILYEVSVAVGWREAEYAVILSVLLVLSLSIPAIVRERISPVLEHWKGRLVHPDSRAGKAGG